jgi:hypothetical protein
MYLLVVFKNNPSIAGSAIEITTYATAHITVVVDPATNQT